MVSKKREYGIESVIKKLEDFCDKYPTRAEAAAALGVTRVFLWKVLNGKSPPTDSILKYIGLHRERTITYSYHELSDA